LRQAADRRIARHADLRYWRADHSNHQKCRTTAKMHRLMSLIACAMALSTGAMAAPPNFISLASGVLYHDDVVGTGAEPKPGQTVTVHYTGWLDDNGKHGTKFDSSRDRGTPFSFVLGNHDVIAGWDSGVATMHIGGKRTLIIPADQAYGDRGAGGVIPPGATLIFDIELLGVQ
jgi:peptidylprolyl isomerase